MVSFTILQQKVFSPCLISICHTMDVIAILTLEGVLTLYRIFSWEKISTKNNFINGTPTVMIFSHSGKLLTIGTEDGSILLVDLETLNTFTSYTLQGAKISPVNLLQWQQCQHDLPKVFTDSCSKTWLYGGLNLAARAGMREYLPDDEPEDDHKQILSLASLLISTHDTILLSLQVELNILTVYMFGIYPVYNVELINLLSQLNFTSKTLICPCLGPSSSILLQKTYLDNNSIVGTELRLTYPRLLHTYKWFEHRTRLVLQMNRDISNMESILLDCNKKWKEVARAIPAKMTLLKSTIDNYQLPYSPIQFLYSIALCGQWHPGAQSTFTSGWNEQGLTRLRTTVESICKDVDRLLFTSLYPLLTNFLLRCRELIGLIDVDGVHTTINSENEKKKLLSLAYEIEVMFLKLDVTYHESQAAYNNFRLFFQFIKTNVLIASSSSETELEKSLPVDPNPKSSYIALFDPRLPRSPITQAEYITGTHLYTQFMDSPLPDVIVAYRKSHHGFFAEKSLQYSKLHSEIISQILQVHSLDSAATAAASSSHEKISLFSQFKIVKSSFQTLFSDFMNDVPDNSSADLTLRLIPANDLVLGASTTHTLSASSLYMKRHHDSKYQLCEHQTNQRTDIVVQACMTVNPDNTSPILHLIWRFVSPIDSKPQYFASIQSFPSDFLLTSTIHTLQLSTFSKLNSLTGRSQTMISIICLYSTSSQSEDIQWSIFRIKLYPFESLDEDDGENQGVWFEDITSLVVSDDDKAIETISLSQLVPLVQPLPNVIEQRCIPSMVNMNACDLLYAPSRGVSAVVLSKDILPEGVVLFDMEENEEEEEEDGDEEEKEEKETLSEEDNDDMMI